LYWVVLAKWISFSKVKIVVTEHNTKNRRMNKFFLRLIDRIFHNGLARIVTISDKGLTDVKKHLNHIPDGRFKLIYNGINLEEYENAKPYSRDTFFEENDFVITQVSNFRKQKDQPTLIRSLLLLPENIKLLLVGEGKLKKEVEKLVHQLNLENRVQFLGARTDVARILKSSDIVVLSSKHEGFGLAIVEGMAASKPCIASRIGGLNEIVQDYGLLFPVGDSKELANQILSLYQNPSLYQEVAEKCSRRANNFNIETMVGLYLSLYKEVLSPSLLLKKQNG
jgi:glycosyltransferase involved in cell wall biosynthesis